MCISDFGSALLSLVASTHASELGFAMRLLSKRCQVDEEALKVRAFPTPSLHCQQEKLITNNDSFAA